MGDIIFRLLISFFAGWYPISLVKFESYNKQIDELHNRIEKLEQENKKLKEIMKKC